MIAIDPDEHDEAPPATERPRAALLPWGVDRRAEPPAVMAEGRADEANAYANSRTTRRSWSGATSTSWPCLSFR